MQLSGWRDKLGITPNFNLLDRLNREWKGINQTERVRGLLNLVVCERTLGDKGSKKKKCTRAAVKKAVQGVVVDISQNPCRRSFTTKEGYVHTLCTGAELVHLSRGTAVTPQENFFLQGHNPHTTVFPSSMSFEDIRKLAGEGMALPCLALCIWGQFLLGKWSA